MRWVFRSKFKNLPILSVKKAFWSCFVGVCDKQRAKYVVGHKIRMHKGLALDRMRNEEAENGRREICFLTDRFVISKILYFFGCKACAALYDEC